MTTKSNHRLPVAPSLLQLDFSDQRPNEIWVSDIAYVATDEGWLFVGVVLDLYSRRAVVWGMSDRMSATLTCDALRIALFRVVAGAVSSSHSDRGSQCCLREYRQLVKHSERICSTVLEATAKTTHRWRAGITARRLRSCTVNACDTPAGVVTAASLVVGLSKPGRVRAAEMVS